ncbi:amidase [Planosporangium thailandense]|uniref:Amidase n=2 Tax=Planosporangium thailandense TaxID=765197 RepID=A0ABX0Y7D0_9ACTN|nr:amidase [Planosporangium thailandense]NJC74017.1 amidase [Planosporangium thailandense]
MSATALAAAIRQRRISASDVVEEHIAAVQRVNPRLNAVVADRFDAARAEARAADARVAAASSGEPLPPLLGVPCTVKEAVAFAGLPNSAGVVARGGVPAGSTAPAAQRLVEAGAIVLGATNTSEMCLWVESENRLYGRTRNPYDPARTAGGSSGGEGAAIGSGASPFGLGSDIGGSIRIPAFCCGVFGHKPSRGLVPTTGSWPPCDDGNRPLFAHGPLARRAEDLMPLLRILAGPDGVDPLAAGSGAGGAAHLGDPADVSLRGLPVLLIDECWPLIASDDMLWARERAAGALAAAGARVQRRRMPRLRRAVESYVTTLARTSGIGARDVLFAAGAHDVDWRALLRRGGPHTVATRLLLVAEQAHARLPRRWAERLIEAGECIAAELSAAIGDGVLLEPTLATTAPRHGRTVGRPWWLAHVVPFNLAGVPVTQTPLGLDPHGLPLGVQVAAGHGRDHVSIAVALELERIFGGWTPPPAPPTTVRTDELVRVLG